MAISFESICIRTNERSPDRNMGFGQVDLHGQIFALENADVERLVL